MGPSGFPRPIGREKVDRSFFADLDAGNLQLVLGWSDPRHNRVFWAYKPNSGTAGIFDKLLCDDYVLQRWAPIAMRGEYLGSLSQPGLTLENVDSISSSLDALVPSLDSFSTSVTPEAGMFDPAHRLGFFRRANLEAAMAPGAQGLRHGRGVF